MDRFLIRWSIADASVHMRRRGSLRRTCWQPAAATATPTAASAGTQAGCVALPPGHAARVAAASDRVRARGCDCGCCAGACCGVCRLAQEGDAGGHCFGCAPVGRRLLCCCDAGPAAASPLLSSHVCHAAGPATEHNGWWLQCRVHTRMRHRPATSDCSVAMTLGGHTNTPLEWPSARCSVSIALLFMASTR